MKGMITPLGVMALLMTQDASTLDAYLEVEEYCEQTEEHSHGSEAKYQQGFPPDPLYHQALRKVQLWL